MNPRVLEQIRGLANLQLGVSLVWNSARSWTLISTGLMVMQGLLPLATLYLTKLTVDAVASSIQAPEKQASFYHILLLVGLTGMAMLLSTGCSQIATIIREHQSQQVTDHVMDVIHRQSTALDLAYYEDPRYHDTLYRAQREGSFRPIHIVLSLAQLFQNVVSLSALAGFLLYLDWWIAVVLFLAVVPAIVAKISHSNRLYGWQFRRTKEERSAAELHQMLTNAVYAKEVRLFDLGKVFWERYRALQLWLRSERLRLTAKRAVFDLIAQAWAMLSVFAMLVFIAWTTIQGSMTLGDMVMYYQAFQRAQGSFQQIMGSLAGLYEDSLFLSHLSSFLTLTPLVASPAHPVAVPRPMQKGIVVEDVSFQYPAGDRPVLEKIRLTIEPGEIVALVGDNGSGKTTLAKLLCRLYDPLNGRITMDGVDFRDYDLQALRREITMIFQDYIHYPLTARENIWIGDVQVDPDDFHVRQAAELAGADRLIRGLPKGYDTLLGNRFEEGVELSIGEWQKIALARAFLRDAQLIILDEPTSAMSVQAEYEVFRTMRELLSGRSALLISHRFSTVRLADKICVLENGRIVEEGSHDQLMALRGNYARLYELQSHYLSLGMISG